MSDVKAVRFLLANNAPLIAVVPAARIYSGVLPQGVALPAISVMHVSTTRRKTVSRSQTELCTSRVQVTVVAATYASQKAVGALVRAALPRSRGIVNGVKLDSILSDVDGPDFQEESGIYIGSSDYMVTYSE